MMFDYHQRETTDEYRENWERIYGHRDDQAINDPPITAEMLIRCYANELRHFAPPSGPRYEIINIGVPE